ncbi:MAG TPA: ABC transporter permease [Stellaceae bacterium]|nr:ABC transporter permease [Stellaceae bacterium]
MPDPVIAIEGVTRTYHVGDIDVHALGGVNFTVERGEFVAIMGSSGSGKSTLMSILGCLDRPSSGRYLLDGIDVARLPEPELARIRSERLGFVFQSFNLLSRTSALENVALPLLYSDEGKSGRQARFARAQEALGRLGLGDRAENTPSQLSGGQQQRVAIARALINSPSLLLADEPTGNLDTRTSHEIMDTLTQLNREEGVTIVLVTHESDIAAYANRTVTMRDGRILTDERKTSTIPKTPPPAGTDLSIFHPHAHVEMRNGAPLSWAFGLMILAAAMQALARNMMRSALTMLGVFIGVAALIAMVAIGQGANDAVRKQLESLGTDLLVVVPGAVTSLGARGGAGSASTLTVSDAQTIRREDQAVGQVAYLIRQTGQTEYANQNWTTAVQGVTANYPPITNWQIAAGRAISREDQSSAALVVVIGQTVLHQLFAPSDNPLGAVMLVKGVPLRVIGTLVAKGQSTYGQDQDDLVMVPFSTAETKVLGVAAPTQTASTSAIFLPQPNPYGIQPRLTGFVNQIYIQARSPTQVQSAIEQVTTTLVRRHRIRPGDVNDFAVRNLSQIASAAEGSSQVMALLLAAVASISLLVGGIGIMNILLVSVTERTREIGLRMAIGARRLHVLLQFLAEAVFLSLVGGVAGIVFGIAVSEAISAIAGWPTPISPTAILGGFAFSAAVGIFFGYYPARKAARLDPIEALRYE